MNRIALLLILALPVYPCTRWWVGGGSANTWAATGNTNWAASSGGANNASVPNSSADVCFDGNSGVGNSVTGANVSVKSADFTGYTGTWTINTTITVTVSTGNLKLVSGMTFTPADTTVNFTFAGAASAAVITSAGKALPSVTINGSGGSWQLGDNMSVTGTFALTQGAFDTQSHTLSANIINTSGTSTRSLTLGSSAVTVSGTGTTWGFAATTGLTLTPGTSTITVSDTSSTTKTFAGGGLTYNNVSVTGGGTGSVTFTGSNTYNTFTLGAPKAVRFTSSTTHTFTAFVANGSAGNIITITAVTAGTQATFSQASGTVNASYLSLKDNNATGGASWNATNTSVVSNVTGWMFGTPPTQAGAFLVGP